MKRSKLKEKLIENGISKEWLDDKMIHISDDRTDDVRKEIYNYLEDRIKYYDELSQTRNGFEDRCKAVKRVLEETLNDIKEL